MTQSMDPQLPDEILSVIPTDPYEQLDLARKITSMAIASLVSKLESESVLLRQKVSEKERVICELQDKLSQLDRTVRECDVRLEVAVEDNLKLSQERDMLALTSKKLNQDLDKLEAFKTNVMQSLSDDNSSQAEAVDIGTCDKSVAEASSQKVYYRVSTMSHSRREQSMGTGGGSDWGWNFGTTDDPKKQRTKCNFCAKEIGSGGVSRLKQHLAGGYSNVAKCTKCPLDVRLGAQRRLKEQTKAKQGKRRMDEEFIDDVFHKREEAVHADSDDDEYAYPPDLNTDQERAIYRRAIEASRSKQWNKEQSQRKRMEQSQRKRMR